MPPLPISAIIAANSALLSHKEQLIAEIYQAIYQATESRNAANDFPEKTSVTEYDWPDFMKHKQDSSDLQNQARKPRTKRAIAKKAHEARQQEIIAQQKELIAKAAAIARDAEIDKTIRNLEQYAKEEKYLQFVKLIVSASHDNTLNQSPTLQQDLWKIALTTLEKLPFDKLETLLLEILAINQKEVDGDGSAILQHSKRDGSLDDFQEAGKKLRDEQQQTNQHRQQPNGNHPPTRKDHHQPQRVQKIILSVLAWERLLVLLEGLLHLESLRQQFV